MYRPIALKKDGGLFHVFEMDCGHEIRVPTETVKKMGLLRGNKTMEEALKSVIIRCHECERERRKV